MPHNIPLDVNKETVQVQLSPSQSSSFTTPKQRDSSRLLRLLSKAAL